MLSLIRFFNNPFTGDFIATVGNINAIFFILFPCKIHSKRGT